MGLEEPAILLPPLDFQLVTEICFGSLLINRVRSSGVYNEDKYSDHWRDIKGSEYEILPRRIAERVGAITSLGCRVSYQISGTDIVSRSKEVALTLFGPPGLLASKLFKEILDILAKMGYALQHPVRHDINIPYENPQWFKFDKTEGTPFIMGGKQYCRKVLNDPRYHSDSSWENERAVFPRS